MLRGLLAFIGGVCVGWATVTLLWRMYGPARGDDNGRRR